MYNCAFKWRNDWYSAWNLILLQFNELKFGGQGWVKPSDLAVLCVGLLAGDAGSNHTWIFCICVMWVFCVVWRRADLSPRGVLSTVMCVLRDGDISVMSRPRPNGGCCTMGRRKVAQLLRGRSAVFLLGVSILLKPGYQTVIGKCHLGHPSKTQCPRLLGSPPTYKTVFQFIHCPCTVCKLETKAK